MVAIAPFKNPPKECLSIGPSQGLVYALSKDAILKAPFQYLVTDDPEQKHCLDLTLAGFVSREKELAVYDALQRRPHVNFPRRYAIGAPDGLFLERLEPLEKAWQSSSRGDRERWVLGLLEAISWVEEIGFVQGDLAIRNLGVDESKQLKLFDFGSAISRSHSDFPNDVARDHSRLATCLHFLLTGVDPFANLKSRQEVKNIRTTLESGQWTIGDGARSLESIIQDGWTGKNAALAFKDVLNQVVTILGNSSDDDLNGDLGHDKAHAEAQCEDWLRDAQRHPLWQSVDDYVSACKAVGYEVDLDIWR